MLCEVTSLTGPVLSIDIQKYSPFVACLVTDTVNITSALTWNFLTFYTDNRKCLNIEAPPTYRPSKIILR